MIIVDIHMLDISYKNILISFQIIEEDGGTERTWVNRHGSAPLM